jgi:hypothetical protein
MPMPATANANVSSRDPIPVPETNLSVPSADSGMATTIITSSAAYSPATTPMLVPRHCSDCYQGGCGCCGCDYFHANCYGIRPLGACVAQHLSTQVTNGVAAQMMLYNYDFNDPAVGDPTKLSPYGLRRLGQMEKWMQAGYACPVMIEENLATPALDTARQMHVIAVLGEAGLAPQVAIADAGSGLSGTEALLVHVSRLQQFSQGGPSFGHQSAAATGSNGGGNSALQGTTP